MYFDESNFKIMFKTFQRENLKFVLYEEDEGFQVITSVKGNI